MERELRGQETILERMEIDGRMIKEEEHHLSGAYIRSLVKQLTSSRTNDPSNPKVLGCSGGDVGLQDQSSPRIGQGSGDARQNQQPQQPQKHKKQVRRRLHTSRPYQERLLNMAEARKEIVTALKYHRATMKQAQEQHQQQQQERPPTQFEAEAKIKSRRNPRIYPSNTSDFTNYPNNNSVPSPNHLPWVAAPPQVAENMGFTLPNQPLGLNLNLRDFSNLESTPYHSNINPSSIYSSVSSPSLSYSPTLSVATEDTPSSAVSQAVPHLSPHRQHLADPTGSSGGLHPAMDEEEMAEIRSIGEQHEIEWNDTMNLVTSAWWFKFFKEEGEEYLIDGYKYNPFDEVMQMRFPSWFNTDESLGLQQQDYNQDPALPCMDIGEFEGMDGEWLS